MPTDELTQAERDEDAFNEWNRDITDYVPSLFDAYLFGLNRARAKNASQRLREHEAAMVEVGPITLEVNGRKYVPADVLEKLANEMEGSAVDSPSDAAYRQAEHCASMVRDLIRRS